MISPLMKPTLVGRDTRHELDQPLKKLAYVSNHWGPLLIFEDVQIRKVFQFDSHTSLDASDPTQLPVEGKLVERLSY